MAVWGGGGRAHLYLVDQWPAEHKGQHRRPRRWRPNQRECVQRKDIRSAISESFIELGAQVKRRMCAACDSYEAFIARFNLRPIGHEPSKVS